MDVPLLHSLSLIHALPMAIPAAVAGDVPGAAAPDDPGEDIRAALSVRRASSKGAIQPLFDRGRAARWHCQQSTSAARE